MRRLTPPWLPAALLLLILTAWIMGPAARVVGRPVYALDDSYIHLSMARSLAHHGVWGVSPDAFGHSSSSPLWTLLLAACCAVLAPFQSPALVELADPGAALDLREWAPLCLNLLAAFGLLASGARFLTRRGLGWTASAAVLLLLTVATPLPTLVAIGMEHTLHSWVLWELLCCAELVIRAGHPMNRRPGLRLVGLAVLACGLRYESLLLLGPLALLLAWRDRTQRETRSPGPWAGAGLGALALGAGGAPLLALGLMARARGWSLLPAGVVTNSHLLGSRAHGSWWFEMGVNLFDNARAAPALVALLLAGLLCLRTARWGLRLLLLMAALQLLLARCGWLYRYEGYLVAALVLQLAAELATSVRGPGSGPRVAGLTGVTGVARALALVLALLLALLRGVAAVGPSRVTTLDNLAQNGQIAALLRRWGAPLSLGLHDIGLVSWYSGARLTDLAGLSSAPVAELYRRGPDSRQLELLLDEAKVELLVVTPGFFGAAGFGEAPRAWAEVGRWTAREHSDRVNSRVFAFYARNRDDDRRLEALLRGFVPRPEGRVGLTLTEGWRFYPEGLRFAQSSGAREPTRMVLDETPTCFRAERSGALRALLSGHGSSGPGPHAMWRLEGEEPQRAGPLPAGSPLELELGTLEAGASVCLWEDERAGGAEVALRALWLTSE